MPSSKIFQGRHHKELEEKIRQILNSEPEYLSGRTSASTRAVGDAVQEILGEHFRAILGDVCGEYSSTFARRAMADIAFTDTDGLYYIVDVKTHRIGTAFNMPNLTSVERLARFYEDDHNYFVLLMVKYAMETNKVVVNEVTFVPIEFLRWDCLTIGALGWGQIQIANANQIGIDEAQSRRKWMITLCDTLLSFYPKEVGKIAKRIAYFESVRKAWEQKVG